jgi:hypothetical protein
MEAVEDGFVLRLLFALGPEIVSERLLAAPPAVALGLRC